MSGNKLLEKIEEIIVTNNKRLGKKITQTNKNLEDKIIQVIFNNNATLLNAVDQKNKKLKQEITEDLSNKIELSQQDTIETLSDVINTGYNLHDERIQRLEVELKLPPIKQTH